MGPGFAQYIGVMIIRALFVFAVVVALVAGGIGFALGRL